MITVEQHGALTQQWTTSQVHPASRLCEWNNVASSTFTPLSIDACDRFTFCAELESVGIGKTTVARIRTQGSTVRHTHRHLAAGNAAPAFLLHLQVNGKSTNSQSGRVAVLSPGDCTLVDSTRPYELEFGDGTEFIVCRFDADELARNVSQPEDRVAKLIDGRCGATRMLHLMLDAIWSEAHMAAGGVTDWLAGTTDPAMSLLSTALSASHAPSATESDIFRRAREFILKSHAEPELSVAQIAAALSVSSRWVQKSFASRNTTPMHYVQKIRIDHALHMLSLRTHSITDIAMCSGFSDITHFGRVFRKFVGVSPRQYMRDGNRKPSVSETNTAHAVGDCC